MNKGFLWCLPTLLFLFLSQSNTSWAHHKSIDVLLLSNGRLDVHWWKTMVAMAKEAGRDLDVNIQVVDLNRNMFKANAMIERQVNEGNRPDVILFSSTEKNGVRILQTAEKYKIFSFLFNSGLSDAQKKLYGGPRDTFKYWLGQMLPDDEAAGFNLAMALYHSAKQLNMADDKGRVHMLSLLGNVNDSSSIERQKGLIRAAQNESGIHLLASYSGGWQEERVFNALPGLLKRHPTTRVIWSANDPMALGALGSLTRSPAISPQRILIGSMDWDPRALEAIKKNQLQLSINGHFMESAWAIVLLYDYFHGKDFANEARSFKSSMTILSEENIDLYLNRFHKDHYSKINFQKFSKALNPEMTEYPFSFDKVLEDVSK